jgi:hypothetical protein
VYSELSATNLTLQDEAGTPVLSAFDHILPIRLPYPGREALVGLGPPDE